MLDAFWLLNIEDYRKLREEPFDDCQRALSILLVRFRCRENKQGAASPQKIADRDCHIGFIDDNDIPFISVDRDS